MRHFAAGTEARAKDILGLTALEEEPHALPIRVERMWRAENFAPHVSYTGSILVPMGSTPDLGLWRDSVVAVAQRHEALHSRLAVVKNRAVLVPATMPSGVLEVAKVLRSDLQAYRDGRRAGALTEFFAAPFNLFEDAGFRCRVFRDEDGTAALGISMHHYFGDAWSSQILRREIESVQTALAAGAVPDLRPAAQYSDYALSQRRALAKNLPGQLEYWHQRLGDAPPAELPFDQPDGTDQLGRMLFAVPEGILEKLKRLSRAARISLPMLCLAAFQLTLAQWCGQDRVVTAVTSADRLQARFRGTVGRLMAGIPLSSTVAKDMPARDFLATLAKDFYDGLAHRDLAFEQYDEIFSPPQPFCTTRFNFIPHQAEFSADGASRPALAGIVRLDHVRKALIYRDLHFLLMEYPDGMLGRVIYNLDFSAGKIESFVTAYEKILEKIADSPDARLGEIFQYH